jgi:hypothetical protein
LLLFSVGQTAANSNASGLETKRLELEVKKLDLEVQQLEHDWPSWTVVLLGIFGGVASGFVTIWVARRTRRGELDHSIAGHAVMARLQGFQIFGLSLEAPFKGVASRESAQPMRSNVRGDGRERQRRAYAMLRCLLARQAALVHYGFGLARGEMGIRFPEVRETVAEAFCVAAQLADDPASLVSTVYGEVAEIIDQPCVWMTIRIIAENLVAHRTLSGRLAVDVMSRRVHVLDRLHWIVPTYSAQNAMSLPVSPTAAPVGRSPGSISVRRHAVVRFEGEAKRILSLWRTGGGGVPGKARVGHGSRRPLFRRYYKSDASRLPIS